MNTFAKNLKQVMKDKDITQTELSRKTGIGKSSISQYLSGKNIPSKQKVVVLAEALDVPVDLLHEGSDEPVSTSGQKNITVDMAAKLMGVGRQFIRVGLQNQTLPFGSAVKMPSGKYRYYISPSKFSEFTGCEV